MDEWRFAPSALRDLKAYATYLDEETGSPAAGNRFVEAVFVACERLSVFPRMGRRRRYSGRAFRAFPVRNHMILYRIRAYGIEISRVIHQRLL